MKTIVVDTNVLISALIKNSMSRKILLDPNFNFIFPDYGLEEIFYYKEYLLKKSKLSEREFNKLMLRILKYVKLVPSEISKKFRADAEEIIGKIDKDDTIFIATAIAFNCAVWSDDKHFKKQKKIKTFTTKEMIRLTRK